MYRLPGFHDSHLHLIGIGYVASMIDLSTYDSIEALRTIRSDKPLIRGRGWHQNQFVEQRFPNKDDLNAISTEVPVVFIRVCGHVLVCNDKAMELAGVDASTPPVEGGTFSFATGVFTENALGMIYDVLPKPTKEDIREYLITGNDHLLSLGITSVASDDFSILPVPYELVLKTIIELYEEGRMQIRLYEQVNLPKMEWLQDFLDKGYHHMKSGKLRMGPLKLLADGSLGGRTAYMRDDYADEPGNRGVRNFDQDTLDALVHLADSHGMDVAIHAIGDGIVDAILDSIERSMASTGRTDHRHALIHAQLTNREQIERMKQLGVGAIVQPIFLNSDIPIIRERLGDARAEESYLFYSMHRAGLPVGLSTDAPVEGANPFYNLYVATTRRSIRYPNLDAFLPDEAFPLEEALRCYTEVNDWFSYEEDAIKNDWIIVDRDIRTTPVEEWKDTRVLATHIDGELVYQLNDDSMRESKKGPNQ
jgi:predicted amidohydrolase YtcJ